MRIRYNRILGKRASWRAQQVILPDLPWNQEVYGGIVLRELRRVPQARWLDAGCGTRILSQGLEQLENSAVSTAGRVIGVDPRFTSLKENGNIATRACAMLDAIPFAGGSFDLVTCNMVVEHLTDPRRCFAEIDRVLAPGGAVIFETPNLRNYMILLNHLVGRHVPRSILLRAIRAGEGREAEEVFPTFYRMNDLGSIRKMAEGFGWTVEQELVLPSPRPFFNFFLPIAVGQLLLTRILLACSLQRFESTLMVVLRKHQL